MRNTITPTKKQYFDGVSNGERETIQLIYDHFFGKIKSFIQSNSGSPEDAKDIFQDALMTIYIKSKNEDLDKLDCSFYTYLYAICRNLWLKKLRGKKHQSTGEIEVEVKNLKIDIEKIIAQKERWDFYREKFKELNLACQKILQLFFEKHNFEEISKKLGLGSAGYAKKKKHLCKKKLIELMMKDKRFNELNDQ